MNNLNSRTCPPECTLEVEHQHWYWQDREEKLLKEIADLRSMLTKHQWVTQDYAHDYCPECSAVFNDHKPDCALAVLLGPVK